MDLPYSNSASKTCSQNSKMCRALQKQISIHLSHFIRKGTFRIFKSFKCTCPATQKGWSHSKGLEPLKRVGHVALCLKLPLTPFIVWVNREGSGETAWTCRLAWDFAVCLCDKYPFLGSFIPCLRALANCECQDQTPQNVTSDQGPLCINYRNFFNNNDNKIKPLEWQMDLSNS